MGIVRNCIDIVGITPENGLPRKINGQLVETSETEKLFIDSNIEIKNIYQIIIDTKIKGTRVINTSISRIVVIDGCKKFKIAYYNKYDNMEILELSSPYNLFFDLENDRTEIEETKLYIADAYFELLDKNIVYCNLLYMLDVEYFGDTKKINNRKKNTEDDNICDFRFLYNQNKEVVDKDVIYKEMSISEHSRTESSEVTKTNSDQKINLVDIDSEYL